MSEENTTVRSLSILPCKCDFKRKFRLGTRYQDATGFTHKYAKIDFGVIGKDEKGKSIRNIIYGWIVVRL